MMVLIRASIGMRLLTIHNTTPIAINTINRLISGIPKEYNAVRLRASGEVKDSLE